MIEALPARYAIEERVGKTVICTFYRPWKRPAIEKVGTVTKTMTYKNQGFMWVEATDGKAKWVSEADFIGYVRGTKAAAEAAAVA